MKKNIEITKFEKASKVENFTIVHYTKLVIEKNLILDQTEKLSSEYSNFKYLSQID